MATIHTKCNSERLVLNQGHAQCDHANQAVRTSGTFYLPSVFGLSWLQPSHMRGGSHEAARHPDPVAVKSDRTGPGRWAIAGHRALPVLRIN